ncbi:MAG TPA: tRNA lysidine(34) synthetase TilS [Sphingomicrobium sp.]|nr:tRNA lysidine(34) synthetase TilS [Sphingomicrobium sp.]
METLEATETRLELARETIERFRRDLDALVGPEVPIGIAVSGGPDSLALLLMAAEVRPGKIEAATVDHALRPESRSEAEMVTRICEQIGVQHRILTASWEEKPATAIQERARAMRYRLLGQWAAERGLKALLTAHHLDDQAETLLMRFARGAGIRGLAGMRRIASTPGGRIALLRPLLGWRRSELEAVCGASGFEPAEDPSNADEQFERVRVRKALREIEWLDPEAIAASAAHLAQAETALQWATTQEWERWVTVGEGTIVYRPSDAPREIRRRIVRRAVIALATEGQGSELRGRELNQVLAALLAGRSATLRGVLCLGGAEWRFTPAPPRRN